METINWSEVLTWVMIVGLLAYTVYGRTGRGETITMKTTGDDLLSAFEVAKGVVAGVEQLWESGQIDKENRLNEAIDQMTKMYPEFDADVLRTTIESGVYWLRQLQLAQVTAPKEVTGAIVEESMGE